MQTHHGGEGEGDAGLLAESAEEIRPMTVEGELRGPESTWNSPLIPSQSEEETGFDDGLVEDFMQGLRLESTEDEEAFEFAFVRANPDGSLISAEEAFQDGKIGLFYPVFGRDIFREADGSLSSSSSSSSSSVLRGNPSSSSSSSGDLLEGLAEGTYCVWRKGTAVEAEADGEGTCRKSNSTGFSRLWRVKDLVMRSNSDGNDTFVFLNPNKAKDNTTTIAAAETKPVAKAATVAVRKDGHHGWSGDRNRRRSLAARKDGHHGRSGDRNRRRSYLPYKVGFFTNINGMSRNVHPY